MQRFSFDRAQTKRSLGDPDGALWPVNAYSDADELNTLLEAALACGAISRPCARAHIYVYPLSICEPEPLLAVDPGHGATLLGHALQLREREGESPLEFTLRLLGEVTDEANRLAQRHPAPIVSPAGSDRDGVGQLRISRFAEVRVDRPEQLDELVRLAANAEIGLTVYLQPPCTCDEVHGCPQCFDRAETLVGATVRDSQGRVWQVTEIGEKDGFPTICGERYWDRPDEVEVLDEPQ
jgi:hypothetical protein